MKWDAPFVQSQPHPICWAGFKSDTYTLQQHGWEFEAYQNMAAHRFALAFRNQRLGMKGITNEVDYQVAYAGVHKPGAYLPFYIDWMTTYDVQFRQIQEPDWARETTPVDMKPMVIQEIKSFEDTFLFAGAPLVRTNEIIIDPNDVGNMMDRILELQDPDKKEHFLEAAKAARVQGSVARAGPRQNFHAQILSIAA